MNSSPKLKISGFPSLKTYEKTINRSKELYEQKKFGELESLYSDYCENKVDSQHCPICSFKSPLMPVFCAWLLTKLNLTQEQALKMAKEEFDGDISKFQEAFKK